MNLHRHTVEETMTICQFFAEGRDFYEDDAWDNQEVLNCLTTINIFLFSVATHYYLHYIINDNDSYSQLRLKNAVQNSKIRKQGESKDKPKS